MPPTVGGVSPPSLLALLGSRCRKRSHYFENEEKPGEATSPLKNPLCVPVDVLTERMISGSFQDRRHISSCTAASKKKRTRQDSHCSDTVLSTVNDKVGSVSQHKDDELSSLEV